MPTSLWHSRPLQCYSNIYVTGWKTHDMSDRNKTRTHTHTQNPTPARQRKKAPSKEPTPRRREKPPQQTPRPQAQPPSSHQKDHNRNRENPHDARARTASTARHQRKQTHRNRGHKTRIVEDGYGNYSQQMFTTDANTKGHAVSLSAHEKVKAVLASCNHIFSGERSLSSVMRR